VTSEFFRRRAAFDELAHRIGVGLCILIAAATVVLLVLTFDHRYDLADQGAAFLGAVIFATTLGLFTYAAARAVARLAHRVKYGGARNQPDWQGELSPRKMTSNVTALISGGASAAAAMVFRLIAEITTGFPQGAGHAIGRLVAAGLIFLVIGYVLTRAILWAMHKHRASGPPDTGH